MKYLLDTCVISELVNRCPNTRVVEWLKRQDPDSLYLSFVTVGEIKKGIAKRGGDARAINLEKWLQATILGTFADRILPVDRDVSLEWGRICGEAERISAPIPMKHFARQAKSCLRMCRGLSFEATSPV